MPKTDKNAQPAGRVKRWAAYKTAAPLLDVSVSTVRNRVREGVWFARALAKGKPKRLALGEDGWPLAPARVRSRSRSK